MKQLLCIWLPNWPIQRLTSRPLAEKLLERQPNDNAARDHQTARDQTAVAPFAAHDSSARPILLWQTDPRRGRLVVAACPRASAKGVKLRMPIAEANELVCSTGKSTLEPWVLEHDPEQDDRALEIVAQTIQDSITPMVAIMPLDQRPWAGQPLHQSDSILCDLDGVIHLFGSVESLITAIRTELSKWELVPKIAIAGNSSAAWAHAHYQRQPDFISQFPLQTPEIELAPLHVAALRIDEATVHTLARLGVDTIGGLLKLPRSGLVSRLGKPLVRRLSLVLGEIEEPLSIHHADPDCTHRWDLEYPTEDQDILIDRVERLIERIAASLAASQRGALRLACRLDLVGHSQLDFDIGLFSPTLDQKHLVCLIAACLETRRLPAPVSRVVVSVTLSGPLRTSQSSLFGTLENGGPGSDLGALSDGVGEHSLARLVDALSGRLGRNSVLGVKPSDDPLPENAVEFYSLTDHKHRNKLKPKKTKTTQTDAATHQRQATGFRRPDRSDARRRPIKLLNQPLPITPVRLPKPQSKVANSKPPVGARSRNGLPDGFRLAGRVHRVINHHGPERIETQWWSGPSIRRDYYVVETDSGRRWWVFRNLTESTWRLHGHFA